MSEEISVIMIRIVGDGRYVGSEYLPWFSCACRYDGPRRVVVRSEGSGWRWGKEGCISDD
jgi:hypothetical protein